MIRKVALDSKGFTGPSGVDVAWWQMCSSYKETSLNLSETVAGVAKKDLHK